MLDVGPFRWFLVVPLPSVVRTRLSWYYNNSLEMDTLVLLSKLLVLLSKIFSTGGFALTSTDKPLNMIFSFFSVVAASSPWHHLIRTANIADLFVSSLFSLILDQGWKYRKISRCSRYIWYFSQCWSKYSKYFCKILQFRSD